MKAKKQEAICVSLDGGLGQRPLLVTCWHISLLSDCNSPFKHTTKGKVVTKWLTTQLRKGSGCVCLEQIPAVFNVGGVHGHK